MRRADLPRKAHPFGKVVEEQDCSQTASDQLNHYLGWGVFCLVGIAMGGWVAFKQQNLGMGAVSAGAISSCFLFLAFLTDRGRNNLIRCHENGVVVLRGNRYVELAFDYITWFRCPMVAVFYSGQYVGTRFDFRLGVRDAGQVTYESPDGGQPALGRIRDHISTVLGVRKLEDLRRGKSVAWAEGMEFTAKGLKVEPNVGKLSGRGIFLVPYSERLKVELDKGAYTLFVGSYRQRQAVCKGLIDEKDFFPGLVVLAAIQEAEDAQEPVSQQPPPWPAPPDEPRNPFDFR